MPKRRDQILRLAVAWLEKERALFEKAAKRLGIPSVLNIIRSVVTDVSDSSLAMENREFTASPMSEPETAFPLSLERSREPEDVSLAELIYERWGSRCHVWTTQQRVDFEAEPVKWVQERLLTSMSHQYLSQLDSLAHPDVPLSERIVCDLFRLLDSPTVMNVAVLPVAGITSGKSRIQAENVTLRKLSREELSDLAGDPQAIFRKGLSNLATTVLHVANERSAIEVRVPVPKDTPHHADPELALHRLVVALELLGFEIHGRGILGASIDPALRLETHLAQEVRVSSHGDIRRCTERQLATAVEIANLVPGSAIHQPQTRQEVALHRFFLGAGEEGPADALIDFSIALEALLLPEKFEGELSFRLAVLGAHYIAKRRTDRPPLYQELRKVYGIRSRFVHGLSPPSSLELMEAAKTARALAASGLLRALREGWPSQEDLTEGALT